MNTKTFKQIFTADDSTDLESTDNVLSIIEDVKQNKDAALKKYTAQFDGQQVEDFKVSAEKLKNSFDSLNEEEQNALLLIKERIADYQQSIKYKDYEDGEFSYVYHPLERIGIYSWRDSVISFKCIDDSCSSGSGRRSKYRCCNADIQQRQHYIRRPVYCGRNGSLYGGRRSGNRCTGLRYRVY